MKRHSNLLRELALMAATTVLACGFTAACHSTNHPDDKQAVNSALDQHDLSSVMVYQDRDKGVIKLTGIVGSQDRKDHAMQLAQQAAPGYQIDNELRVDQGSLLSSGSSSSADQANAPDNGKSANSKPDSKKNPKK